MRRAALAQRHEVDENGLARVGRKRGFEDEGVVPIATRRARGLIERLDLPMAVARLAEQRSEARAAIEARPAQPIDGAAVGDEGGGLAIADERVVLDPRCHGAEPVKSSE